MNLTRRFVVLGAAAAAGMGAAPTQGDAAERLARIIPHAASARTIGRAWLAAHPDEREVALLEARLLGALALERRGLAALDNAALRAHAVVRIRADFAAGRTVTLGGWVLARTEARLCAVSACR